MLTLSVLRTIGQNNILLAGTTALTPKREPAGLGSTAGRSRPSAAVRTSAEPNLYDACYGWRWSARARRYATAMVPMSETDDLWQSLAAEGRFGARCQPLAFCDDSRTSFVASRQNTRKSMCRRQLSLGWRVNKLSAVEIYEIDLVANARKVLSVPSLWLGKHAAPPASTRCPAFGWPQ